jgi:serine/threonine-protein kinase
MAERWGVRGYTEVRQLGGGATGTVVLATAPTGDLVAIKYLAPGLVADPVFRDAFRGEARRLAGLRSPHLVQLYDYVETDDGAAVVMRLVEGTSLRATLTEHGAVPPESALAVLKGALLGLRDAHGAEVLHRDLRPANVLVALDGHIELADVGIAGRAGPSTYLAPEQRSGGSASPSGDLYAAVATFVECLLGRPPGPPDGEPSEYGELPEPVRELVRRVLTEDPAARPADAGALLDELERAASAAYGEGWEARGTAELGRRAALLAPPLIPDPTPASTPPEAPAPRGPASGGPPRAPARSGRLSAGLVVAGVAAALAVGGLVAGALISPRPMTPSAPTGETRLDVPADDGAVPAIGDPQVPAPAPLPAAPPAPLPVVEPPPTAPGSGRDDDEPDRNRDQDSDDDGDRATAKKPKEKPKKKDDNDGGSSGSSSSGSSSSGSSGGGSSEEGQSSGSGGGDSSKDGSDKGSSGKDSPSKEGSKEGSSKEGSSGGGSGEGGSSD